MKEGDLVEQSAKSLRVRSGSWPSVRSDYKVGIVIDIDHRWWDDILVTILWNNGFQRTMRRSYLKHVKREEK
jgi:hypothetical protein